MEKICPECGERFRGRSDKKFCCDSCRANFHNRIYKKTEEASHKFNRILTHNRNLLRLYCKQGKRVVNLKSIRKEGFDPDFCTASRKRLLLPRLYYCYEFSYCLLQKHIVNLKKIDFAKYGYLQ